MVDRPPASFIADQISIAISQYMGDLLLKSMTNEITHQEYLQKQYPIGCHDLISKAAANAVALWNHNQKEELPNDNN